jgi:hypothetical protein
MIWRSLSFPWIHVQPAKGSSDIIRDALILPDGSWTSPERDGVRPRIATPQVFSSNTRRCRVVTEGRAELIDHVGAHVFS